MIRTNETFLNYIGQIYNQQQHTREEILIRTYERGDYLFFQQEKATEVMLIRSGFTKCFFEEENEKEYIIEFLGKGEIIGDIEYLRKINGLCHIQALEDVEVYVLSYAFFASLLQSDFFINALLLDVCAERIVNTASRASYQQLHTIEYSLQQLLVLQEKQGISLSKENMAAYLGISVRSLNRSLKGIKEEK